MNKEFAKQYEHPKWQKKRLEILKRDEYKCQYCGDTETQLHIHHLEYEKGKKVWESDNQFLITTCKHCHSVLTFYNDTPLIKLMKFELNGGDLIFGLQCSDYIDAVRFAILDIQTNKVKDIFALNKNTLKLLYKYFK